MKLPKGRLSITAGLSSVDLGLTPHVVGGATHQAAELRRSYALHRLDAASAEQVEIHACSRVSAVSKRQALHQRVDERCPHLSVHRAWRRLPQLQHAVNHRQLCGSGVKASKCRPIIGHQPSTNHLAAAVHRACDQRYLEEGGELVQILH